VIRLRSNHEKPYSTEHCPTPAEIAEFHRLRQRADGDYRITTGQLFNGPKPQQQLNQGVEAVLGEEEGPVGGEQEGAVGIEETEEKENLIQTTSTCFHNNLEWRWMHNQMQKIRIS
jgi:hypothetical protein